MERTPVQSSAIRSVGHDPTTNELEVEFSSGYVYRLGGISAQDHAALLNADSIGRHMNTLKAKASSSTRIGGPQPTDVVAG